jgi:hypothetical protein
MPDWISSLRLRRRPKDPESVFGGIVNVDASNESQKVLIYWFILIRIDVVNENVGKDGAKRQRKDCAQRELVKKYRRVSRNF